MTDDQPTDAEAALALLHEGEEPYVHEFTVATPAQWIWLWNRATPAQRLAMADRIQYSHERAHRCHMGAHEERLQQAGAALAAVARVRALLDKWIRYAQVHQTMRALSEVRAALDGTEQPATGGAIGTASFRQVGEGPVCDGNLLPRREPGAARAAVTLEHPALDTPTLAAIVQALAAQAKQQEPDETEPADPNTGLVVGEYRTDRGHKAWVFRCWGDDASGCDGYLALDKTSEAAAIRARDRHVAEKHTAPAPMEG